MMSSFDSSANSSPNYFLGIRFIGNFGSSLCLSRRRWRAQHLKGLDLVYRRPFQRAFVGNLTAGNIAVGANLNIAATNVSVPTQDQDAGQQPLAPNNSALSSETEIHQLPINQLPRNPQPVTPVKINRLKYHLAG